MSRIWRYFFPSSAPAPQPSPIQSDPQRQLDSTIHSLRDSLATLTSRELALQREIDENRSEAKNRLRIGDKNNAQLYLVKAKLAEKNLSDTISNKLNIHAQISTLQNSVFTNQLISNMEQTRATFRAVSQDRDPEFVKSLILDVTQEMNKASLVQASIASPLVQVPSMEISDELAQMQSDIEQEKEIEADKQLLGMVDPPTRSINRRIVADQSSHNHSSQRRARQGPRIVRVENGVIIDSRSQNRELNVT